MGRIGWGDDGYRFAPPILRTRLQQIDEPGQEAMSPSKMPEKAFPVSWDQFHRDARALAWRLNGEGPFVAVVAVTRGGLVPAAIVARELGIRVIETVCVASYDYDKQGAVSVLKAVGESIVGADMGAKVLIV